MSFYHFTCLDHGLPGIRETGQLQPFTALPVLVPELVWLTDLESPHREALGLTSELLECDRTAVRIPVQEQHSVMPWWRWRRAHPEYQAWARVLEDAPGVRPAHWFVSAAPLPIDPKELP